MQTVERASVDVLLTGVMDGMYLMLSFISIQNGSLSGRKSYL